MEFIRTLSTFGTSPYHSFISLAALYIISASLAVVHANESSINENRIKATHLYQIAKFVDWPSFDPDQSSVQLCVFEHYALQGELQKIHLLPIKERTLHVRYINPSIQLDQCNILYLSNDMPRDFVYKHYKEISENHVLTIGEDRSFAKKGGAIAFRLVHQKLHLEINLQAAKDADISISANLVELATKVYDVEKS